MRSSPWRFSAALQCSVAGVAFAGCLHVVFWVSGSSSGGALPGLRSDGLPPLSCGVVSELRSHLSHSSTACCSRECDLSLRESAFSGSTRWVEEGPLLSCGACCPSLRLTVFSVARSELLAERRLRPSAVKFRFSPRLAFAGRSSFADPERSGERAQHRELGRWRRLAPSPLFAISERPT